jgi:uncharacterized protein (TIGR03118 family)
MEIPVTMLGSHRILRAAVGFGMFALPLQLICGPISYIQTNLTSDLPGVAQNLDPNLVNPWGIAFSSTSPIWIADNHTGLSTVYNGAGKPFPIAGPLVVTIPPPNADTPTASPTGIVFTNTGFGGSHFIFATEDGTISAWSGGTTAALEVDNSADAVYKGLARVGTTLYATNFSAGTIDVFDTNFSPITVSGGFADHNIPAGFAPFDIENIGGMLYVTYAKQDAAKHDDVAGAGNGFVDVFDASGTLQKRLISNGPLNSPWGMAVAPAGFGSFANDLLVGNFGDGTINAFDLDGNPLGELKDSNGNPIVIPGLWALAFGNGANGTSTESLYFTAGIPGSGQVEDHGLFGSIHATPEPASLWTCAGLFLMLVAAVRFKARRLKS